MATALAAVRSWRTTSMTSVSWRLSGLFGSVALLHLVGWGMMLLLVAPRYPVMLGLGGLAYAFGLRHAFDADHISAIDNTTRKLLQEGKKPLGVGFFFSLGHSTVVLLIAVALGIATQFVQTSVVNENGQLKSVEKLIGTGVSAEHDIDHFAISIDYGGPHLESQATVLLSDDVAQLGAEHVMVGECRGQAGRSAGSLSSTEDSGDQPCDPACAR